MPSPRNWQTLLDSLTFRAKDDGVLTDIAEFWDQEAVLKICFRNEYYREKLLEWITTTVKIISLQKSASKASTFRQAGNDKFRLEDYSGSLSLYSESVRYAPDNSEELSLALANRSAALLHMDLFEECLQDILLALDKNYPLHLQHKLYVRQGECLLKLGRYRDAITALESARECLQHVKDAPASKMASAQLDIDDLQSKAVAQLRITDSSNDVSAKKSTVQLPCPSYGENDKFIYASQALDLKFSKEKGRHVVANRNIEMGDFLFVEKPFAFVVLPDQYERHCHHCVKAFITPVPCPECIYALYCNEKCREESWLQYHQWECHGGLELMHSVGIAHLGLRVVLKAGGLRKIRAQISGISQSSDTYGNKDDNYPAVYQLMPHLEDMLPDDRLQYGLTAALLTLYLVHHTDYFGSTTVTVDSEDVLFVGGLILRHVAQLVCNAHAITKLDSDPTGHHREVVSESQVRIATAIYPSASMMNHSCDPNIINSFYDEHLIVRAYKDIPKGGEVYNCYGPHFQRMSRQERLEVLKCQYFFLCNCPQCLKRVQYEFQERFSGLLCSSCGGPVLENTLETTDSCQMVCSDCGVQQSNSGMGMKAFKAHNLFEKGCSSLEMGNVKEALQCFQTCLQLQKKCLYKNNMNLVSCMDHIAKCYAMLGEYGKSAEYLMETIPAVEEMYGAHSIEVANELQKHSDVMICDLKQNPTDFCAKHKKTVECVKKAKQILELHCGLWNSGLQEIVEKEQWLTSISK